jgi:hypothetical protein
MIERHLEDTLAEAILANEIAQSESTLLIAKLKDDKVYFEPGKSTPTPAQVKKEKKT